MSVPRTVPSSPPAFIASSAQIIRSDDARNSTTNNTGDHAPWLCIHVKNEFKGAVKQGGQGRSIAKHPIGTRKGKRRTSNAGCGTNPECARPRAQQGENSVCMKYWRYSHY